MICNLHTTYHYPIAVILRVIHFSRSTFYYHRQQLRHPKDDADRELLDLIREIHDANPCYGYRRITLALRNQGIHCNKKKVQRLMRKVNIRDHQTRNRYRKYSSYRGETGHYVSNRIHRRFDTSLPHQKITTDTTEFKLTVMNSKGIPSVEKVYLDPYMDMYNREIISYQISRQPNKVTMMKGLETAIQATNDCPYRRTFHSDRG